MAFLGGWKHVNPLGIWMVSNMFKVFDSGFEWNKNTKRSLFVDENNHPAVVMGNAQSHS